MRKRRSDSPWGKLTREQTRQMDTWRFEDNLSYAEIVKRALHEFGVQASEQTLTSYFKYRRDELNCPGDRPDMTFREKLALLDRPGMGKDPAELEARTLLFAGMAAYELSLAEPEKMQVREMRTLLKMLQDSKRSAEERKLKAKKQELQELTLMARVVKDKQKLHTKEQFEEMVMQCTDILGRARQRGKEQAGALAEEKAEAATANTDVGEETNAGTGRGAREEVRAAEPEEERSINDIIKDTEAPPQA